MKKMILFLTIFSFAAAVPVFMLSCGSGGGGAGGGFANENSSSGSVALYVTDDLGNYRQVRVTIKDIRLEHIGSGASCDILENPVTIDLADLSDMLQLLDVTTCPSINYNRVIIKLDKQTVLVNAGNASADCDLATYKSAQGSTNALICDPDCSINMSGAVNVLASKTSNVAIDFDLNEFEVNNFGESNCSLSMKVFPLNASDFDKKHEDGFNERISGVISELDTVEESFTLTAKAGNFTVKYADVTAQGINDLLALAALDQLTVKVDSSLIDLNALTIAATDLHVEAEGTVSALDTVAKTFTLTYQTIKTIPVIYQTDGVEGNLLSDSDVKVKLNGYSVGMYVAAEIDVN